ncbi:ABC transporter permease [Nocardioides sp.]|uniref:ABC transporter permease n=1 Tax=Nocardioides sp. TaxID=35761 RepID=UPI002ED55189
MSVARRRAPWLAGLTGLYLFWSLAPVLIAVLFSFNAGRSRTEWQGFSFQWYYGEPDRSVWADQALQTALVHTFRLGVLVTLIAVPLGTLMALGLDRWRGRLPTGASFLVMLSFVLPEILLAISLLFVATAVNEVLATPVRLGTLGQVIGLVTFQLSYPVIIVRARLLTIGHHYEEAAVDLGASPIESLRRVLLPLAWPAILASAVLVFADVIDDFVLVRYLSGGSTTEPVSVKIYNTARAAPTPALNAVATLVLVASLLAVLLGYLAYRRMTRGEDTRTVGIDAFTGEA